MLRWLLRWLLAGTWLAGSAWAGQPVDFGRYHALVIGNEKYRFIEELHTAIDDAEAVAQILKEKYGFEVTLLRNATRDDILEAFNRFRGELTERDNLLIYYAGHGTLEEVTGTGYWQPVDASPTSDTRWISSSNLSDQLTRMSAKHVLVIADSCYSGALLTRGGDEQLRAGVDRDIWIRRMAEKGARTALTAGGLEPVLDGGGGGHSVFAGALLEVLRGNEEILDGDGLFDRVKLPVARKANQTVRYSDIRSLKHEGGDFLLVPKDLQGSWSPEEAPVPLPDDFFRGSVGVQTVFWQSIKDRNDPAYFHDYLERFPDGLYAGLARLRLEELARSRAGAAAPARPGPVGGAGRENGLSKLLGLAAGRKAAYRIRELDRSPKEFLMGLSFEKVDSKSAHSTAFVKASFKKHDEKFEFNVDSRRSKVFLSGLEVIRKDGNRKEVPLVIRFTEIGDSLGAGDRFRVYVMLEGKLFLTDDVVVTSVDAETSTPSGTFRSLVRLDARFSGDKHKIDSATAFLDPEVGLVRLTIKAGNEGLDAELTGGF